jgi:enolase
MAKIKQIIAEEVLNAKGMPTVQTNVVLDDGVNGLASCSSDNYSNYYEAKNINDIKKSVEIIKNIIAPSLIGKNAENQQEIDRIIIDLAGTQNKERLGANSTITVSIAVAKAASESSNLPLYLYLRQFLSKNNEGLKIPLPVFNIIKKGHKKENVGEFYNLSIIPASSKTYEESIRIAELISYNLNLILDGSSKESESSDDGLIVNLSGNKEAINMLQKAVDNAKLGLGFDVFLGLNAKASLLYNNEKYVIKNFPKPISRKELIDYYKDLNREAKLLYIEDPFSHDDWEGWSDLFQILSASSVIVGGDLTATNPYRLQTALLKKAINGIVIKPGQTGTVIESLAFSELTKSSGLKTVVSRRDNETNDDFIADFAVAVNADYVKFGSLDRGENIAKYNRLMQIENQLKVL